MKRIRTYCNTKHVLEALLVRTESCQSWMFCPSNTGMASLTPFLFPSFSYNICSGILGKCLSFFSMSHGPICELEISSSLAKKQQYAGMQVNQGKSSHLFLRHSGPNSQCHQCVKTLSMSSNPFRI